jgi:hypothetical protein
MDQGGILIWSSSYQDLIISNTTGSCDTLSAMELVRRALTKYGPLYTPIRAMVHEDASVLFCGALRVACSMLAKFVMHE